MCLCRKLLLGHSIRRYATEITNSSVKVTRNHTLFRINQLYHRNASIGVLNSFSERDFSTGRILESRGRILKSRLDAELLIRNMSPGELEILTRSLSDLEEEKQLATNTKAPVTIAPDRQQLFALLQQNAIPFIGFGFLDNAIMIVAGDYIDSTIGITFGISTMAAAAIGNLISDFCGIGLAGYVEMLASRLGINPNLSSVQMSLNITKRAEYGGRAIGIIIGCLLGMIPLLFLNTNSKENDTSKQAENN